MLSHFLLFAESGTRNKQSLSNLNYIRRPSLSMGNKSLKYNQKYGKTIDNGNDSLSTNHNLNFIIGDGCGIFIFPYLELGANYNEIYLTGEFCFMWLGGYGALVCQYEYLKTDRISASILVDYGSFGGAGIRESINIKGGGIEYRLETFDSKAQGVGRLTLQFGTGGATVIFLQIGFRLKI